MLRALLIALLWAGCWSASQPAAFAEESEPQPQEQPSESVVIPADAQRVDAEPVRAQPLDDQAVDGQQVDGQTAPTDSVSRGYYANYPAKGYYAPYVYPPNYPPRYPKLLGYGLGIRGHMLYHPRYICGHPSGYLREHCPNDHKYGPVYYESGMPVAGSRVEWLHTGAGVGNLQSNSVTASPAQQTNTNSANPQP